jgi:predicted RNA-binding protein YlqC (UPF0109 family)
MFVVRSLANHSEDVQVESIPDRKGDVYLIQSNPADAGD